MTNKSGATVRSIYRYQNHADGADDSPESFADAPLSLQIAGPRWEDEKVLKAIEIVSKVVLE